MLQESQTAQHGFCTIATSDYITITQSRVIHDPRFIRILCQARVRVPV